ncbi:zf-HC2 domain-containing protein [Moorella sp. E306M]|uniref:zf-HC2 domain-containing protein n=1 Tax=Moorella sp. E306M TaxID=2572683 RepID=UPI00155A6821|nr:zf-HC2 domain-containing protein [Moorella sp. E306M]
MTAMNCRQARRLLSPYFDNEVGVKERDAIEKHLAVCPACREELEALRKISAGLQEIYRQVKAPPGFSAAVMARIEQQARQREANAALRRPAWMRHLAAAAAVAVLAGGTVFLAYKERPGGATDGSVAWQDSSQVEPPAVALAPGEQTQETNLPGQRGDGGRASKETGSAGKAAALKDKNEGRVTQQVDTKKTNPELAKPQQEVNKGQISGQQPEVTSPQPASQKQEGQPARVFLSNTRHSRSTLLKLKVANLPAVQEKVLTLATQAGAESPQVVWVWQNEETILRLVVPVQAAGKLVEEVAALGEELERHQETNDITAEYNRKLAEYQLLAGQKEKANASAGMLKMLQQQLKALEKESLEAGHEIVNIWLMAR